MVEIQDDLFQNISKKCLIAHVVNNRNVAGAGFILGVKKHFPKAIKDYHNYFNGMSKIQQDMELGNVIFSQNGNIIISHMIAQTLGGKRPLRYDKLVHCMELVRDYCEPRNLPIIAPRFGSNLSRGDWSFVRELIQDIWVNSGLDITIYYL